LVLLGFIFPDISLPLLGGFFEALRHSGLLAVIELSLTCGVLIVLAAVVVGFFGPSPADTARIAAEERGLVKDPNGDGYITMEELNRRCDEILARREREGLL